MLTNFGPCHEAATEKLRALHGGYWLPVSNGTVALEVMLKLLPPYCQRVLVPDFTFAATALAVVAAGRTPVIGRCEARSLTFDLQLLREKRGEFDAILGVAPFGYCPRELEGLEMLASSLGVPLLWDFAGAYPMMSEFPSAYSLHAAKSLPVGEGGLLRFQTEAERDRARTLICFGFDENKRCFDAHGSNGKMDELRCAVLLAQLENHDRVMARIRGVRGLIDDYQTVLRGRVDPFEFEHERGFPSLAALRGLPASRIVEAGVKAGVVFRPYYAPLLSSQPAFRRFKVLGGKPSDRELQGVVAFPTDVTDMEFEDVVSCVLSVVDGSGR